MAKNKYVSIPKLEEYSERFKDFFSFKRENGILEVKMHTLGEPVLWSYQFHNSLSELWTTIGHDRQNEVLILTSTTPHWINEWDNDSFTEVEQSPDNNQRFNCQIYDTFKIVENFIYDIEIPTIAAITGPGIHWEMCLMSDITLCSPDFVLRDEHFKMSDGHVPGDGMALTMQEVLGTKRGNYMMMMCSELNAQECLELGVVNEVVEKDKVIDRAWEIARYLMTRSRPCRRLTHMLAVRPWKCRIQRDFPMHVLSEMYSHNLSGSAHEFEELTKD